MRMVGNNNNDPTLVTTNVQVCARIRPLVKSNDQEFFHKSPSPRKSLGFIQARKLSSRRKTGSPSKSTPITNEAKGSKSAFVAWDVCDNGKTASQSTNTKLIQGRTHSYTLDRVFGTEKTTNDIYSESVSSLIKSAMEGYNSTVLAYGQTSTGKTHTMTGKKNAPGLVPLSIRDCFKYVKENNCAEPREYLFRFSYLEIYKEHIRDLLASTSSAPDPVRLLDGPSGLVIRGLKEEVVSSPEKVFKLLKQGEKRRQIGATHMNQHSSRSHVIMRLKIESSVASKSNSETRVSLLSLVDLAGSESVRLNGAERRDEGQYINKSLMALGQCVFGLSESFNSDRHDNKNRAHIPYRDSKLTRLLQTSLSGNAQMMLMCCISPLESHVEESHNTLKFATRAKRIEQTATIQTTSDKEETLLQTYRTEIDDLRKQLAEAKIQKQKLLEDQRAYHLMKARQSMFRSPGNDGEVSTTSLTPNSNDSKRSSYSIESTSEEIDELVEAIQTMEQLILKNRSLQKQQSSTTIQNKQELETSHDMKGDNLCAKATDPAQFDNAENKGNLHVSDHFTISPFGMRHKVGKDAMDCDSNSALSPSDAWKDFSGDDQLHSELTRIRGLLGSVLKKRSVASKCENVSKNLDFSTPSRHSTMVRQAVDQTLSDELNTGMTVDSGFGDVFGEAIDEADKKKAELESLRLQLEQQERTTSLRKADSHFLQSQLEEKDKLLEEVSSLLEAVEKRQGELELENLELKRQLQIFKERRGYEI